MQCICSCSCQCLVALGASCSKVLNPRYEQPHHTQSVINSLSHHTSCTQWREQPIPTEQFTRRQQQPHARTPRAFIVSGSLPANHNACIWSPPGHTMHAHGGSSNMQQDMHPNAPSGMSSSRPRSRSTSCSAWKRYWISRCLGQCDSFLNSSTSCVCECWYDTGAWTTYEVGPKQKQHIMVCCT